MAAVGSFLTVALNKILTIGEEVTYIAEKGMDKASAAALAAQRLAGVSIYGVYFKLQSFIFMPIFGMNNGMIPIIAYNYGKRSKERILKTVKLAVIAAVVYMLIGFAVFQTLSGTLLKAFYQPDTEVSAAETAETEPGPESASAVESPSEAVLEYGEPIYPKDLPKEQKKFLGAHCQEIIQNTISKNQSLV